MTNGLKHIGVLGMTWGRTDGKNPKLSSEKRKPKDKKAEDKPTDKRLSKKLEIGKRKLDKILAGTIGLEKVSGLKKMPKEKAIRYLKAAASKFGKTLNESLLKKS